MKHRGLIAAFVFGFALGVSAANVFGGVRQHSLVIDAPVEDVRPPPARDQGDWGAPVFLDPA